VQLEWAAGRLDELTFRNTGRDGGKGSIFWNAEQQRVLVVRGEKTANIRDDGSHLCWEDLDLRFVHDTGVHGNRDGSCPEETIVVLPSPNQAILINVT
jgi:hypothetical protein